MSSKDIVAPADNDMAGTALQDGALWGSMTAIMIGIRSQSNVSIASAGLLLLFLISGCSSHKNAPADHVTAPSSGTLAVTVIPASPRSLDKATVSILDTSSLAKSKPAKVEVSLSMLTMDMGSNVVPAISDGQGKYHADVQFTMPGEWMVKVTVQRPTMVYDSTYPVTVR